MGKFENVRGKGGAKARLRGAAWLFVGCMAILGEAGLAAQSSPMAAATGLQLQVDEKSVDLTRPAAIELHVALVNTSPKPVRVWPGSESLVAAGNGEQSGRCDSPPNDSARLEAAPQMLAPGGTYRETLALNADVCNWLRGAKAVKVQRVFSIPDGTQMSLESQPVPVQNAGSEQDSAAEAIRAVMTQQAADWNRGDLDAFASGYKNSPDILFMGRKLSHGYDGMLAAYKQGYGSREAMGTLSFSDLEVQPLDERFATTTGRFHLERTTAGGGNADGYFLLVLENTASGWKVVRDDTTALPAGGQPSAK